jgi:hypothetical protein
MGDRCLVGGLIPVGGVRGSGTSSHSSGGLSDYGCPWVGVAESGLHGRRSLSVSLHGG